MTPKILLKLLFLNGEDSNGETSDFVSRKYCMSTGDTRSGSTIWRTDNEDSNDETSLETSDFVSRKYCMSTSDTRSGSTIWRTDNEDSNDETSTSTFISYYMNIRSMRNRY